MSQFNVAEQGLNYHIDYTSNDKTSILIDASETADFEPNSIFKNVENATSFFKKGAIGYSPNGDKFEGLKLSAYSWEVRPLDVQNLHSSFYENEDVFPKGSIKFDNALLMTKIEHEWKSINMRTLQIN